MKPWAKLCAAYPQYDQSKATLVVFYERLCRFDVAKITAAVEIAIDRCKFFPTIAELIANIQQAPSDQKLLAAPRPSKQEAGNVLRQIQAFIAENEKYDQERADERIRERKALLKHQAMLITLREHSDHAAEEER